MQINKPQRFRWVWAYAAVFGWAIMVSGVHARVNDGAAQSSGPALPPPVTEVMLIIDGLIEHKNTASAAQLDAGLLQRLPRRILRTRTSVTDGVHEFEGVLMRDLMALVGADGDVVQARALNGYQVAIPMSDFSDYDVLLASRMDGETLLPTNKGPFWIVYPRDDWRQLQDIRYDTRWVWQLHRLTIKQSGQNSLGRRLTPKSTK